MDKNIDSAILEIAIKKLSQQFDEFIDSCLDNGKPKAPDIKSIMRARACLPSYCKNAFKK